MFPNVLDPIFIVVDEFPIFNDVPVNVLILLVFIVPPLIVPDDVMSPKAVMEI